MTAPHRDQQKFFSTRFLYIVLIISILTNIVLIIKLKSPSLWHTFQYAFIPAPKVAATDHVRGNANAKITIIEYSDLQCPYCAKMHDALRQTVRNADVRWVYRHFPLASHPLAGPAAEAAECAADQGKFWEYTDALFAQGAGLSEAAFGRIARDLDLNTITFQLCLSMGQKRELVAQATADAAKLKISGTPTLFINGKRYNGFLPEEELQKALGMEPASQR